ncbi:MAG: hypothetical protein ACTSVI_16370 [Promethearchaeota archaeon]
MKNLFEFAHENGKKIKLQHAKDLDKYTKKIVGYTSEDKTKDK